MSWLNRLMGKSTDDISKQASHTHDYLYDLVVMGSSSTEVFDYIFGNQPRYHPFWASAWSARGLRKSENIDYVQRILADIDRQSNVFLNFGNVDTDYNLRYKIHHEGFSDFERFAQQMVEGLTHLKQTLLAMGFLENRIFATFLSPPVRLDYDYWLADDVNCYPAPTKVRGGIIWQVAHQVEQHMQTINLLQTFSDHVQYAGETEFYPALSGKYTRETPDHHPDYIKTKDIIWQRIQGIEGILPKRERPLIRLYPHQGFHIEELKKQGIPRPRTCLD